MVIVSSVETCDGYIHIWRVYHPPYKKYWPHILYTVVFKSYGRRTPSGTWKLGKNCNS